jgi:hypothetical protein
LLCLQTGKCPTLLKQLWVAGTKQGKQANKAGRRTRQAGQQASRAYAWIYFYNHFHFFFQK